jgi:hypothetical protein
MDRRLVSCVGHVLLACGVVAGCRKASPPHAEPSPAATAKLDNAVANESARQPTAPQVENPRDFGALFQNEAANRPTGTIKAEDAIEAFRKAGVELVSVRQHLARPYGARYCVGAKSGAAIALSVCEYIDAAAASTGAELSRKVVLANREIRINQATSLTVREVEKTPAADALANKLFDSFAKLSTPLARK